MANIDIESAIAAHKAWSGRIRDVIEGKGKKDTSVNDVQDHTACVLGRYLYGVGQEYSLFNEYHKLLDTHQQFHEVATSVLQLHEAGDDAQARFLLDSKFQELTDRVIYLLNELKLEGY